MSDTEPMSAQPPSDPTQPTHPADPPTAPVAAAESARPAAPVPVRLRDQVFGFRSLVAVAVAGVVLGGLAGFGINAATGGEDHDGRISRFGGPGLFRGPGDGPGGPGQMGPGQLPPGQPGPGQLAPGQPGSGSGPQQPSATPSPTS